jgi:hypothetical protein
LAAKVEWAWTHPKEMINGSEFAWLVLQELTGWRKFE